MAYGLRPFFHEIVALQLLILHMFILMLKISLFLIWGTYTAEPIIAG